LMSLHIMLLQRLDILLFVISAVLLSFIRFIVRYFHNMYLFHVVDVHI
jgi:hypothetical protein